MDDDAEELVSRLFALLTAHLEDCVTLAVEGQGRHPIANQHERAQSVAAQVRDAATIAEALLALSGTGAGEAAPGAD